VVDGLAPGDVVLADAAAPVAEGDRVRTTPMAPPGDGQDPATRKELPAKLD
jgi:hypothetical protein